MRERLVAGPAVKTGGTTVIPVSRLRSWSFGRAAYASMTPVAVVVVAAGRTLTLPMDAGDGPAKQRLEAMPELARLISEANQPQGAL